MSDSNKKKSKAASDTNEGGQDETTPRESLMTQATDAMSKAAEATRDVGRRAAGAVGDAYRGTVATGVAWEEGLERYIRRNPMTSILVTAGVSLLVGFMLGRETAKPPSRPWPWPPRRR